MTMTRKHYESIAEVINKTLQQYDDVVDIKCDKAGQVIDWDPQVEAAAVIDRLITNLLPVFEADNDRFDKNQFRSAIQNTWYQFNRIDQAYDEEHRDA
jgi:hypothetical protein